MGSWVLILVLLGPNGITSSSSSYVSKYSCEQAAALNIKAANVYTNLQGYWTCSPGGA